MAIGAGTIAGLSAAAGVAGSLFGGQQAGGSQEDYYKRIWDATGEYRTTGDFGAKGLRELLADPQQLLESPEYKFNLSEGLRGVTQRAGAAGTSLSGGTLKDLTKFAGGLATNTFQTAFQNRMSMAELGLKGLGQYSGLGAPQPYEAAGTTGMFNALQGGLRDYAAMTQFGSPGGGSSLNVGGAGGYEFGSGDYLGSAPKDLFNLGR